MRENWKRASPQLQIEKYEIERIIAPAFASARLTGAELAEGGLANTNIKIFLAGRDKPLLLKLFTRDAGQAAKEYNLSKLAELSGVMPEYFFIAEGNEVTGHPFVIMEWVEGRRLELDRALIADTGDFSSLNLRRQLARSLGGIMARIHGIAFECSGFLDQHLNVVSPVELGKKGLIQHGRLCLLDGLGQERLGERLTEEFFEFAESKCGLLDDWPGGATLTHSDFGGSNILVDGPLVKAVLDWEFAFSGNPAFDFGNLLRADFGPEFEDFLARAYVDAGGQLPAEWRTMSLMADLYSWLDFVNRPAAGTALIDDAKRIICQTIQLC